MKITGNKREVYTMQHRITTVLIWIGFIAFLATSIPHVAYIFHSFEGADNASFTFFTLTIDKWYFLSYLEAISIDVLIAWLSHILTSGKTATDKKIGYIFICILVGISWFFNWLYAKINAPLDVGIWSHKLLWGWINLHTVTPIITSALPVFAIGYSFMLSKLTNTLTIEELKAQLEERKQVSALKSEYANKGMFSRFVKDALTTTKGIVDHAESTFKDTPTIATQTEEIAAIENLSPVEVATTIDLPANDMPTSDNTGIQEQEFYDTSSVATSPSMPMVTSSRYASIEEASTLLNCQPPIVKQLLTRGKLKSPHGSNHLVTRASIKEYNASKRTRNKKENGVDQLANEVPSSPTNMADFINDVVGMINDVSRESNQSDNHMDTIDHEGIQDTEALPLPL